MEELDMSGGEHTDMSFSFNSFATLLICIIQSSRNLCMEYVQLVLDLSL